CGLANSESERVMREPDSVNSQTTGQERGHMHVIRGAGDVFGNMANTGGFWSNADWLPCRDGKARPVESATERMADGLSDSLGLVRLLSYPNRPHEERLIYSPLIQKGKARVGRLRGYGNAIVPEVAQAFIESYLGINL
ncbi:MAG TPA: hypothetical protein VMV70_01205, partial [Gallionella sp.]|nr:hypothetical protein [Gallionella sp.]